MLLLVKKKKKFFLKPTKKVCLPPCLRNKTAKKEITQLEMSTVTQVGKQCKLTVTQRHHQTVESKGRQCQQKSGQVKVSQREGICNKHVLERKMTPTQLEFENKESQRKVISGILMSYQLHISG